MYRGIICKFEIKSGSDVLLDAQEAGKNLYNFARYCLIGFNRKLARARGHSSLAGRLPQYPGAIGMWKALKDTEEYRGLNERAASYILRGLDSSTRSFFSNIKRNPDARPPRHIKDGFPPLTFEIGANARIFDDGMVRLTALSSSKEKRHVYIKLYIPPLTCPKRIESIKILSDGRCAVSYKLDAKTKPGNGVAAIDLGINRLAVIAFENGESIMYTGSLLLSVQRYFQKKIAKCKPSGWKGAKDGRKLGKSERFSSYYDKLENEKAMILRNMAASIVKECVKRGVGTVVVGDLKGIREDKDWGNVGNQKLHAWPFARIVTMITSVAEEAGIKVVKHSERNTSRTCCVCGNVDKNARTKRGLYSCRTCGTIIHADVNGAFNQLNKYLYDTWKARKCLGYPLPNLWHLPLMAQKYLLEQCSWSSGVLPHQPSHPTMDGIEKQYVEHSQIEPCYIAKFDLRTFEVVLTKTHTETASVATADFDKVRV